MGNTTFSGPIRSQNGTKLISKNSTTGLIQDRTIADSGVRDARRFFLEEWFLQRPGINANIDQVSTVEVQRALNRNWEALGTNMTTALATFNTTSAGILLTTATADQDQAIITPHLDTAATAWAGCLWGTENQVHFETSINTTAIDNQKVWAGLKLTNDHLVATDDDQAYFKFQTDATNSEAFTDFTKLHFVHSVGGTDFISQLPITVAANTIYNLKITIDSNRKASIFVDGVQYNVTGTSGSTGGTAVTTGTTPSGALDDDIDLIPYVGLENGAAAAEAIGVHYVCMSRTINE
jgi:hypothetical protein|tara:strand:+ start:4549 stop:5430 length:882 start_codon:yes stop_codon:yes gene_type:complete